MVKLQYILDALNTFFMNESYLPELAALDVIASTNPWDEPRDTPWMTYFWRGGIVVKDTTITADLDIMIIHSAESEEGPMNRLTAVVETIIDALFKADNKGINAVDADGKPIKIGEIRPLSFRLTPEATETGWTHVAVIQCQFRYVR